MATGCCGQLRHVVRVCLSIRCEVKWLLLRSLWSCSFVLRWCGGAGAYACVPAGGGGGWYYWGDDCKLFMTARKMTYVKLCLRLARIESLEARYSIDWSGLGTEAKPLRISLHLGTISNGKEIFRSTEQHFAICALHSVPTCSALQ